MDRRALAPKNFDGGFAGSALMVLAMNMGASGVRAIVPHPVAGRGPTDRRDRVGLVRLSEFAEAMDESGQGDAQRDEQNARPPCQG